MAPKRNAKARATAAEEGADEPAVQEQSHADALIVALLSGASVPSTVDAILQLYRDDDPNIALAAVVNAVSKAAGVQGTAEVPAVTVRDETAVSSTLEELFARVPVDSGAYFLVNKDPKYKRFRKTLPEFFERLVQSSYAAGFLFDDVLMTTILQWLFAMSESKARSFRHTSTVAVLAVISGLNDQIRMLAETIQTLKKKDAAAKQADYDKLIKLQEHVFTIVVHQRAKDIAPEIRLSVVQALRHWFMSSPEIYLSNKYLRYLSISLHDKKPELRAEALEILIQILGNRPAEATRLRDFLKHYANRLLEMVNDIETRVADLAIKVIALVVRADTEAGNTDDTNSTFNNNMIDHVLLSLFDERGIIRAAAGTFLKVFIRCRLADDSEKTARARTELLCTFASIFREVHRERNPEKYLVDALWRDDNPPSMLTQYGPILDLLNAANDDGDNSDGSQVVVSLSFVAALLQRMKGPLTFGPVAKDDMKVPIGKVDAQRTEETAALRIKLSKDVGVKLNAVLANHGQNPLVVVSVAKVFAQLDLNAFTTSKESHQLCECLETFRALTANIRLGTEEDVADLADAWFTLAFTEHKFKDDAGRLLHDLMKVILKQLAAKGGVDSDTWARVRMLSRLASLNNQWVIFQPALSRHVASPEASPAGLQHLLAISLQSVLWNVGEMALDPTIKTNAIKEQISEVVELYLQLCKPKEDEFGPTDDENPDVLASRALAFGCLCDIMTLPVAPPLSQLQQEDLVEAAFYLVDRYNDSIKKDSEAVKNLGKKKGDSGEFTTLLAHRHRVSVAEATVSQIVVGLVRLFTYEVTDKKLSASALLLWTRVSVKAAADVFKTMFHNTRESMKDSYQLEHDILVAAYQQCSAQGSNAIALENLYQVGVKLSSMHFLLTDRFYPACVSIVRFGVNFAVTVDPAMLQAITPYCSRLKQSDALTIANGLTQHDIFVTQTVNPFIRSFISAIRRAARLEDPGGSVAPAGPSVGRAVSKRPREVVSASAPRGTFEADDILSEIVRSNKRPAPSAAKGRAGSAATAPASGRQVTKDGWHVASGRGTPTASQLSQASAQLPQTQESVLSSMLGDLEDEVFIATQEYE